MARNSPKDAKTRDPRLVRAIVAVTALFTVFLIGEALFSSPTTPLHRSPSSALHDDHHAASDLHVESLKQQLQGQSKSRRGGPGGVTSRTTLLYGRPSTNFDATFRVDFTPFLSASSPPLPSSDTAQKKPSHGDRKNENGNGADNAAHRPGVNSDERQQQPHPIDAQSRTRSATSSVRPHRVAVSALLTMTTVQKAQDSAYNLFAEDDLTPDTRAGPHDYDAALGPIVDSLAVLRQSIIESYQSEWDSLEAEMKHARPSAVRNLERIQSSSDEDGAEPLAFDVTFVLLVAPSIPSKWYAVMASLGWSIRYVPSPVKVREVRSPRLQTEVVKDGAMGITEMCKVEGFRMAEFDTVVMVDSDFMVHRPLSNIRGALAQHEIQHLHRRWKNDPLSKAESVSFSADQEVRLVRSDGEMRDDSGATARSATYSIFTAPKALLFTSGEWAGEPVNGGFLVFHPHRAGPMHWAKITDILREGDFRPGSAWRGTGIGWTYGGRTIQGLLPYYFFKVVGKGKEDAVVEKCVFNSQAHASCANKAALKTAAQELSVASRIASFQASSSRSEQSSKLTSPSKSEANDGPAKEGPHAITANHFTGGCQKPYHSCRHKASIGTSACKSFHRRWWDARSRLAARLSMVTVPKMTTVVSLHDTPFGSTQSPHAASSTSTSKTAVVAVGSQNKSIGVSFVRLPSPAESPAGEDAYAMLMAALETQRIAGGRRLSPAVELKARDECAGGYRSISGLILNDGQ